MGVGGLTRPSLRSLLVEIFGSFVSRRDLLGCKCFAQGFSFLADAFLWGRVGTDLIWAVVHGEDVICVAFVESLRSRK
jgi:hypothetical protein